MDVRMEPPPTGPQDEHTFWVRLAEEWHGDYSDIGDWGFWTASALQARVLRDTASDQLGREDYQKWFLQRRASAFSANWRYVATWEGEMPTRPMRHKLWDL